MTGEENHTHMYQPPTGKDRQKIPSNHTKNSSPKSIGPLQNAACHTQSKSKHTLPLPLPKGESAYALAKVAEYKDRDLKKAEYFYQQAIRNGERVESAIKDLASLLHQQGRTKQACEILEKYKYYFKHDKDRYENLYATLYRQINCTGNSLNKAIKLSGLAPEDDNESVRALFSNSVRMQAVEFYDEEVDGKTNIYCILRFNSHSSARKTLEGFHRWDKYRAEWISINGEVMGDAHYARHKLEEHRKECPTFDYTLFERDPQGYIFCMALDANEGANARKSMEVKFEPEELLGKGLFSTIFREMSECN